MRFLGAVVVLLAFQVAMAGSAAADPYISMGDSSSTTGTYVSKLYSGFGDYSGFDEELGADEHISLAQGGAVLGGVMAGQLPEALTQIAAEDDTKAVTIGIGGNEGLGGCFSTTSECGSFRTTYGSLLGQVRDALSQDPGEEFFAVLAYFNPKNGLPEEADFDRRLLGANLIADRCPVAGSVAGLNDVILQAASTAGVSVADAYPAFKVAGQGFIGPDLIHPNAAGNLAIAEAFLSPLAPVDCPADPPPPPPTCETDPESCQPVPTCETDPSLCQPRDLVDPVTRLVSMKRKGKRTVTFRFTASEPGSFRCLIDGRAFARCGSPKTYRGLGRGRHLFRVRAVDEAGNVDATPVRRQFRIRK